MAKAEAKDKTAAERSRRYRKRRRLRDEGLTEGLYRKLDPRIYADEKFRRLGDFEKLLAIYVLTGAHVNRIGLFEFSIGRAWEQLTNSDVERVASVTQAFQRVVTGMGWQFDASTTVLWLPHWWRYNVPESNVTLQNSLDDLHNVPNSRLLDDFACNVDDLPEDLRDELRHACVTLASRSASRSRHTRHSVTHEHEQEQEQERKQGASGDAAPPTPSRGSTSRDDRSSNTSQNEATISAASKKAKRSKNPTADQFVEKLCTHSGFDDDDTRDALREWIAYKRERGEAYKSLRTVASWLRQFDNGEHFARAVVQSIGSNWAGLFADKSRESNGNGRGDLKGDGTLRSLDALLSRPGYEDENEEDVIDGEVI